MDSNPYEPPVEPCSDACPQVVDDGTNSRRHPVVRFLTFLLVVFVVYFGIAGLLARIEPGELVATIVVDVLVGVALIALFALNSRRTFGRPVLLTRFVPALVFALMCSGALIGWHCLTLHLRYRAIELHRQWEEQQSSATETVE